MLDWLVETWNQLAVCYFFVPFLAFFIFFGGFWLRLVKFIYVFTVAFFLFIAFFFLTWLFTLLLDVHEGIFGCAFWRRCNLIDVAQLLSVSDHDFSRLNVNFFLFFFGAVTSVVVAHVWNYISDIVVYLFSMFHGLFLRFLFGLVKVIEDVELVDSDKIKWRWFLLRHFLSFDVSFRFGLFHQSLFGYFYHFLTALIVLFFDFIDNNVSNSRFWYFCQFIVLRVFFALLFLSFVLVVCKLEVEKSAFEIFYIETSLPNDSPQCPYNQKNKHYA